MGLGGGGGENYYTSGTSRIISCFCRARERGRGMHSLTATTSAVTACDVHVHTRRESERHHMWLTRFKHSDIHPENIQVDAALNYVYE